MTEFLIPAFNHSGSICLTGAEMHLISPESKIFFCATVGPNEGWFEQKSLIAKMFYSQDSVWNPKVSIESFERTMPSGQRRATLG